jgi:iduronate 2-sulfatase
MMTNRRDFLRMLGAAGSLAALGRWGLAAETAPRHRNVLLICVDDLKPLLGCYGSKTIRTPNIDRLAAGGTLFRRAYVQQAVCAPSRNAMLTGLRPETLGVYDLGTFFREGAPDAVTLPQRFKAAGYQAESVGKIFHVGHGNKQDHPTSWTTPLWMPKAGPYGPSGGSLKGARPPALAVDAADDAFPDGQTAREAVNRLQALKDRPFFLGVGFMRPHLPFVTPKKYWDLFNPTKLPVYPADATLPVGTTAFAGNNSGELRSYSDIPAVGPVTPETARHLVHGYHASVAFVDAQVGIVLDELDRLKLRDNTIVVFWGDHGWHLGDHGLWAKHTNFEQAAQCPLIISAPGRATGRSTDALVEVVDLFPTLCELAGFRAPAGLDGASITSLFDPSGKPVHEAVFHCYPRTVKADALDPDAVPPGAEPHVGLLGRAVRDARYRYVEWRAFKAKALAGVELYDYTSDPEETRNLANDPAQADTVKRLAALLAARPAARAPVSGSMQTMLDGDGKPRKLPAR